MIAIIIGVVVILTLNISYIVYKLYKNSSCTVTTTIINEDGSEDRDVILEWDNQDKKD